MWPKQKQTHIHPPPTHTKPPKPISLISMSRPTPGLLIFQDLYRSYKWWESSHNLETEQLQQKVSVQRCCFASLRPCVSPGDGPSISVLYLLLLGMAQESAFQQTPTVLLEQRSGTTLWESLFWEFCRLRAPDHVHPYSLLWPRRPSQTFNCEQLPLGAQVPSQWTHHRKRSRLTSDSRHCISHPQLWRMGRATEHPMKLPQLIQVPTSFTCTCSHGLKQRKMSHGFLCFCGSYTGVPKSPCSSGLLPRDWLPYSPSGPSQGPWMYIFLCPTWRKLF